MTVTWFCQTCDHAEPLHDDDSGPCGVDGCACRAFIRLTTIPEPWQEAT